MKQILFILSIILLLLFSCESPVEYSSGKLIKAGPLVIIDKYIKHHAVYSPPTTYYIVVYVDKTYEIIVTKEEYNTIQKGDTIKGMAIIPY